jgi:hypothetical protein
MKTVVEWAGRRAAATMVCVAVAVAAGCGGSAQPAGELRSLAAQSEVLAAAAADGGAHGSFVTLQAGTLRGEVEALKIARGTPRADELISLQQRIARDLQRLEAPPDARTAAAIEARLHVAVGRAAALEGGGA